MDPREYDRIADLLMQIRKRLTKIEPKTTWGKHQHHKTVNEIEILLHELDELAMVDARGML